MFFSPGDNKRIPGWMQLHYRMAFDGEGYPQMYASKSTAHQAQEKGFAYPKS